MHPIKTKKNILKERAKFLSLMKQNESSPENTLEVLTFSLSDEYYAIETSFICEVYPLELMTRVPCTPSFVLGVINVRGQLFSVLDLGKFFNLPERGIAHLNKIILVSNSIMECGIFAKSIGGIYQIALNAIQDFPTFKGIGAEYVKGVTSEGLILLNLEKILSDKNILIDENV